MDLIGEIFIEFFFRRLIAGFFGYYTLYLFYKVVRNKKGIKWLEERKRDGEEFGKGVLIGIVGVVSFSALFILIGILYDLIVNN